VHGSTVGVAGRLAHLGENTTVAKEKPSFTFRLFKINAWNMSSKPANNRVSSINFLDHLRQYDKHLKELPNKFSKTMQTLRAHEAHQSYLLGVRATSDDSLS
jgi:hypothetical protein